VINVEIKNPISINGFQDYFQTQKQMNNNTASNTVSINYFQYPDINEIEKFYEPNIILKQKMINKISK
jgi:hypothetical protein